MNRIIMEENYYDRNFDYSDYTSDSEYESDDCYEEEDHNVPMPLDYGCFLEWESKDPWKSVKKEEEENKEYSKWSSTAKSSIIELYNDGDRAYRPFGYLGCDLVTANKGVNSGIHVWEFNWNITQRGEFCPQIGIVYGNLENQELEYTRLSELLLETNGCFWNLQTNDMTITHPKFMMQYAYRRREYYAPSKIIMILDLISFKMSFICRGMYIEHVPIDFLRYKNKKKVTPTVYPAVSMTSSGTVRIKHLQSIKTISPQPLFKLAAQECVRNFNPKDLKDNVVPKSVKDTLVMYSEWGF